jgi:hypothetical protein
MDVVVMVEPGSDRTQTPIGNCRFGLWDEEFNQTLTCLPNQIKNVSDLFEGKTMNTKRSQ